MIAANILPALSLVLIFLFPTKNPVNSVLILKSQLTYQLAISLSFITVPEDELGKSMMSSSQNTISSQNQLIKPMPQ
jgi:hypothetical protein